MEGSNHLLPQEAIMTKEKEKRDQRAYLLISKTEKRLWKEAAAKLGLDLTNFIRLKINELIRSRE
jgi:uncharacterized protein (DUF1778 family)